MSQSQSEYTQEQGRSFPITTQTLRLWAKQGLDLWILSPRLLHGPVAHGTQEKRAYLPSASFPHHSTAKNATMEGREAQGALCNYEIQKKLQ